MSMFQALAAAAILVAPQVQVLTPRGTEAIGPKEDDPRSPVAVVARPGDDEDPQARAPACEVMQR